MHLHKHLSLILELVIFLLHLKIIWSQARFYATKTATKCFARSGESELQFSPCKPGQMILIEEAFQGTSKSFGSCEYQWDDCISPVITETEARLYRCIGGGECAIPITQGWMSECQAYSDYVSVLYKCVAAEDVTDICSSQVREIHRTGYIKSFDYPNDYKADLDCQCNITTDFDQKILLTFSDFAVEWSEDCYSDVLEIRDGYYEYARCGRIPRNHNLTSHTNRIEINFKTDRTQQHKGFWLQVEALGDIRVSCASQNPLGNILTTSAAHITTDTTTVAPATTKLPVAPTFIPKFRSKPSEKNLEILKPTKNIPIFGSTNYKITIDDEYHITGKHGYDKYDNNYENEIVTPTTEDGKRYGKKKKKPNSLDKQFDLLLTQDFLNKYVTNWNSGDFGGQLGGYDNYDDNYTTGGPDNEKVKPDLVISPVVGIIIGCVLLVILILVLVCICVWRKRRRKKKAITKADRNEPKLTKHSYPSQVNSPRPSTSSSLQSHQYQGSPSRVYIDNSSSHYNDNITTQYPENISRQFPDNLSKSFPDSPAASARSFESDNSYESGRSGLRRGERVKKHYKRSRMSPRLDTAHYPSREEMDQINS